MFLGRTFTYLASAGLDKGLVKNHKLEKVCLLSSSSLYIHVHR
uniref:Uncharacterized protein n=1 Tax=Anguilla anguilla TaxID=7936 RepID=A0A0E9WMF7_ANGAN